MKLLSFYSIFKYTNAQPVSIKEKLDTNAEKSEDK